MCLCLSLSLLSLTLTQPPLMQLTTDRGIFSIFEQIRSSSRKTDYDEQPLHGYERVVDILSFHALDSISGKLPKGGKLESSSISGAGAAQEK